MGATLRVQLVDVEEGDDVYETLHVEMKKRNCSRLITGSSGTVYRLPFGRYDYVGTKTKTGIGEILDAAQAAAKTTGKKARVLVTKGSQKWVGLETKSGELVVMWRDESRSRSAHEPASALRAPSRAARRRPISPRRRPSRAPSRVPSRSRAPRQLATCRTICRTGARDPVSAGSDGRIRTFVRGIKILCPAIRRRRRVLRSSPSYRSHGRTPSRHDVVVGAVRGCVT